LSIFLGPQLSVLVIESVPFAFPLRSLCVPFAVVVRSVISGFLGLT
jgi:hypothetical protein